MAELLPITFQEHLQLPAMGISPAAITFQSTTMTSDRHICVREAGTNAATGAPQNQVVVVDLSDPSNIRRRPIQADAAMMHPLEEIIALKAGTQLQLFNLATKSKVASYQTNEDVQYWSFLTPNVIGMVGASTVMHWDISVPNSTPQKVFDRHPSLNGAQIIGYKASADESWMVLIGILSNPDPNGFKVKGALQLYSRERGVSQPIEGHAASFATIRLPNATADTKLFTFASRTAAGAKLHVIEIDHNAANPPFAKTSVDIFFPPDAAADFPVSMQVSRQSIIYLVTKLGYIHLYDLETATCIYMRRISGDTVFVTTEHEATGGIIGINRKGQVLSVSIDEQNLVPYILQTLGNQDLAFRLASKGDLPGADDLYVAQFQNLLASGSYGEAARVAATSPRGILRTQGTIETLKALPVPAGGLTPILQYFGILLEKGQLNHFESLELVRPVLTQGRKQLLEKWLQENKLEYSEELGDTIKPFDVTMALSVYLRANAAVKVVSCFAELGQFQKILLYSAKTGFNPDYTFLLQHLVRVNPDQALEFATMLHSDPTNPLLTIDKTVDILMSQNLIQQATAFLLDVLKGNLPEQAHLQTRLLEMNLLHAPMVADAVLSNKMFTHFDQARIASLCEQANLPQRALELFTEINDIKRIVVQTNLLPQDWLVNYFGNLTVDQSFACLQDMMDTDPRQNLQVVVQIATRYSDLFGPVRLMEMFEQHKSPEGLYYYLGSIVNITQDQEVVFKYIQAATRTGQIREVERVCRESNAYNPDKVKNFLKEAKLTDQLPLIIVCDRFDFVHDLVLYLYQNNLINFIETYVQQVNSERLPAVVGGLLDVDCDENTIKRIISSVSGNFSIDTLVDELETRNRLKLILPWLNACIAAGQQDTGLYNALAKINIDSNNNPESFLKESNLYDPIIVGKYCEKRDPYLAYIAYAKGFCDQELIAVTSENGMYKHQARYLVKRRELALWQQVLTESNTHRGPLLDQVIGTAVPEATDADDVSLTVKALMVAELTGPLIKVLEKIILEPTSFSDNKSLQSLLMLTAIRTDKGRVMGYIDKLTAFDAVEIAKIATVNGLHEEAFAIYQKAGLNLAAVTVLVEDIISIDRATQFAESTQEPAVWTRLAKAQLDALRIKDAIDSYTRAEDPSNFHEVIELSNRAGKNEDLIRYLQMARRTLREPEIDTELAHSYAKTDRLAEMEEFLGFTNVADLLDVGERCFTSGSYQAAKIVFSSISNYGRLAAALVYLDEFTAAVEAARKAGNTLVWKTVHQACVERKEFRLAQVCALNLIIHAEELEAVVKLYEQQAYIEELISLLEAGLGLERAHMGMFTELAMLYAKYKPDKCLEHLKLFSSRINIPKVLRTVERAHLWPELVYLYLQSGEHDNAALSMLEHAEDAWRHDQFKDIIVKVTNTELFYAALRFYLDYQPLLLNDLLAALTPRVDHTRVVKMFKSAENDNVPLIRPYLISVQRLNNAAVNEAFHDVLIEEEDWASLQASFTAHDNFNALQLAKRLREHELLEFRRLAAKLYRSNRRWEDSISLSKTDKLFKDAIETARASESVEVAEDLMRYFADIGAKECVGAILYTCYPLIRGDVVMELSWTHSLGDYIKPWEIQRERDLSTRLQAIEQQLTTKKGKADESHGSVMNGFGNLMITQGTGVPTARVVSPPQSFVTGFTNAPKGYGSMY